MLYLNGGSNMKRIVALIYHSYLHRKLDIVYLRTLMTIIGGVIVLMVIVWIVFKITAPSPFNVSNHGVVNIVSGLSFVIILLVCLSLLFKKKELEKYNFTKRQLNLTTRYVLVYFITLIAILTVTLILHAKHII